METQKQRALFRGQSLWVLRECIMEPQSQRTGAGTCFAFIDDDALPLFARFFFIGSCFAFIDDAALLPFARFFFIGSEEAMRSRLPAAVPFSLSEDAALLLPVRVAPTPKQCASIARRAAGLFAGTVLAGFCGLAAAAAFALFWGQSL